MRALAMLILVALAPQAAAQAVSGLGLILPSQFSSTNFNSFTHFSMPGQISVSANTGFDRFGIPAGYLVNLSPGGSWLVNLPPGSAPAHVYTNLRATGTVGGTGPGVQLLPNPAVAAGASGGNARSAPPVAASLPTNTATTTISTAAAVTNLTFNLHKREPNF